MIQEFKTYLVCNRGLAMATATAYEKDNREFAKWMKSQDATARWSEIDQQDVEEYVIWLTEQGKTPATINRHIASLKAMYKWFMIQGWLKTNPIRYTAYKKQAKKLPNVIDTENLMTAIDHSHGTLRIMLLLLWKTGIRVQEMLDIELTDIEPGNYRIRIHGKGSKERYVYMDADYMKELTDWSQGRGARIFGDISQRAVRRAVYQHLSLYCKDKQLSPHAIRHTFASNLAKNGAPTATISRLLGHEKLETAQKYVNLNDGTTREQYLQFN